MEKVKKSYAEIFAFGQIASSLLPRPIKDQPAPPQTKFTYAIERTIESIKRNLRQHAEREQDLNMTHCLEKDGAIVQVNGEFQFSKEAFAKLTKAKRELQNEKVDVEVHLCTGIIPTTLTIAQVEALRGFVIPQDFDLPEPDEEGAPPASRKRR